MSSPRPRAPWFRGASAVHLWAALSLLGYGYAAIGLGVSGSPAHLRDFLLLFGSLFVLLLLALRALASSSGIGGRALLGWALLFRLALVPAGLPHDSWPQDLLRDLGSEEVTYRPFLLYDNDIWRYLWDGRVTARTFDPYAHSPAEIEARADAEDPVAEALLDDDRWLDVFDQVTYKSHRTVYPPLAQAFFAFCSHAAPTSVAFFKLLLILFDLGTCWLLVDLLRRRGAPLWPVALYAWNPLAIKEIAGSAHLEGMMVFFLTLTWYCCFRGWHRRALLAFAASVLTKLTPILVAPLLMKRTPARWWPLPALVVAGAYLPFLDSLGKMAEGLSRFAAEWTFNAGPWKLFYGFFHLQLGLPGRGAADLTTLAATGLVLLLVLLRDDGTFDAFTRGAGLVLGTYLVLGPTVMPWYLLWVLPLAALHRSWAWLSLTALSLLSYRVYIDQREHTWWLWVEFGGFFAVWLWELRARRSSRPPA